MFAGSTILFDFREVKSFYEDFRQKNEVRQSIVRSWLFREET